MPFCCEKDEVQFGVLETDLTIEAGIMNWRFSFLIAVAIYFAGLASVSEHLGARCFAQDKSASETEIPSARRIIERYIATVGGQMELDLPEHMRIDFRVEEAEGSAVSATEQFVQAGDRWRTTLIFNVVGWQYGMDVGRAWYKQASNAAVWRDDKRNWWQKEVYYFGDFFRLEAQACSSSFELLLFDSETNFSGF